MVRALSSLLNHSSNKFSSLFLSSVSTNLDNYYLKCPLVFCSCTVNLKLNKYQQLRSGVNRSYSWSILSKVSNMPSTWPKDSESRKFSCSWYTEEDLSFIKDCISLTSSGENNSCMIPLGLYIKRRNKSFINQSRHLGRYKPSIVNSTLACRCLISLKIKIPSKHLVNSSS